MDTTRLHGWRAAAAALALGTLIVATPRATHACPVEIGDDDGFLYTAWSMGMAVTPDGRVHCTYQFPDDNSDYGLRYAVKGPGGWTLEPVSLAANEDRGESSSLAVDPFGVVHVSYVRYSGEFLDNVDLYYSQRTSSGWSTPRAVATSEDVGEFSSIAVDALGLPRIAYYWLNNSTYEGRLRYAVRSSSGSWSSETIDSGTSEDDLGLYPSLALTSGGVPHVSYYDYWNGTLKYAWKSGSTWLREVADGSSGDAGEYTSLRLTAAGEPRISYYDAASGNLKFASKSGGTWSLSVVDSAGDVGKYTALVLDSQGNPWISYLDVTRGVRKLAIREGGSWRIQELPTLGSTRGPAGLHVDAGLSATIATVTSVGELAVTRCLTPVGVPERGPIAGPLVLRAWPIPLIGDRLTLEVPEDWRASAADVRSPVRLAIFDVCGRRVRDLSRLAAEDPSGRVVWDCRDDHGRRVDSGVYFARGSAGRSTARAAVTVVH